MGLNRAQRRELQRRQHQKKDKRENGLFAVPSLPQPQAVSPSRAQRAASLASLESFDGMAGVRNVLRDISVSKKEWAGIPLPLDGERLVIEPTYPKAAELMAIGLKPEPAPAAGLKVRSDFFSHRHRCRIYVLETDEGRVTWTYEPEIHHFKLDLRTLGCSDAWGIEQESNAVHTLAGLVRHRQFKQYMLTGMFIESSPRSGVSYVFRRLKPTVAIRAIGEETRIMCALCMHPIAYYEGSWAGAMCPTDDVIAHLMLMRGDEPMFWKRSSQHPATSPAAGL